MKVTARRSGYAPATTTSSASAPVALGTLAVTGHPAISGDIEIDDVLRVAGAGWSPTPTNTAYQWYADGSAISGATGPTLTLGEAQVGHDITVAERGTLGGYTPSVLTSTSVGPIVAGTITVTDPFTVTGGSHPGDTLTSHLGTVDPLDATVSYQWLRAGVPIAGATSPTYVVTPADVGTRPALLVTLTRKNYRSATTTALAPDPITSVPLLRAVAHAKPAGAVVKVHLTAPGVQAPGGRVTISIGSRTWTTRVVDGLAVITAHRLPSRTWPVKVAYSGTSLVDAGRTRTTVTPEAGRAALIRPSSTVEHRRAP